MRNPAGWHKNSMHLSVHSKRYQSLFIRALLPLGPSGNRKAPSFIIEKTKGAAHSVFGGSMTFCSSILPILAFSNSLVFRTAGYEAKWTGRKLSLRRLIRYLATLIRQSGRLTLFEVRTECL